MRIPRLPHGDVIQDLDRLTALRRDESHLLGGLPLGLALPRTPEDLAELVAWAKAEGGGLVPRGAGTGKAGGCLARPGDLVVDLSAWPRTLEVRPSDLCLRASANHLLHEVKTAAQAHGLFYPPDPNSWQICGFGGSLATNAGGPNACKYGMTRHWVLEVEALLADGALHRFGIASVKANAGPNLAQLLIGSEGIFGLITAATVRLAPLPASRLTLLLPVDDFHGLLNLPGLLCANGFVPSAFEFWDPAVLRDLREHGPEEARRLPGQALALLEFDDRDCEGEPFMAGLARALGPLAAHLQAATEARARESLWQARRMTSAFLKERYPNKVSEDIAVPRSRLAEFFVALENSGIPAVTYGHLGDGNLHVNLLAAGDTPPQELERQLMEIFRMSVALGGALSGEHGVGLAKRDALQALTSPGDLDTWRAVKTAMDPHNIFNPGKVL